MRLASLLNTAGGGAAAPGAPQREAFGKAVRRRPKNPAWEKIGGEALGREARKPGLQRECTVGTWVGATVGRGGGGSAVLL